MSDVLIRLQHGVIDPAEAFSFLQVPRAGGHCLFLGTTRTWTDGKETVALRYECYEAMARSEMERLAEEARKRWPVLRVVMIHRLGEVPAPEASVLIGVATPHRVDAFAACRFLIDTLKQDVPIWKQEVFRDGHVEWVEGGG